ncbi:MAG: PepSY domain-containing protein [Pseudomonadales bacterium]|nr:PepSY domain-containing protein [Pseudomonadales bacterium]MCP5192754.1 PepSY domain-containing protein [Pseudomonadales bacterium]
MNTSSKHLIALTLTAALVGSPFCFAVTAAGKPFEGAVIAGAIAIDSLPAEVQYGSIPVSKNARKDDRTLAGLTSITSSNAAEIAGKAVPGKVVATELEVENGYLVWSVEMVGNDPHDLELLIDAGNGRLLAVEQEQEDKMD